MEGTKIIKAYCEKTKQHFGLEIKQFGAEWRVVNFTPLSPEEAELIYSEIKQPTFLTDKALLPCLKCGSRTVGGCSCSRTRHSCKRGMKYQFDCVYCDDMQIDYSLPSTSAIRGRSGEKITLTQGKEVKIVTFSNVTWKKFDSISYHPSGARYNEPKIHVVANNETIEFHGYNVSAMNEGVIYYINESDEFEIECDVVTSTIQPHPGGKLYITLGIINAELNENGGTFYLNGNPVANVGARFNMRLSLTSGGLYEIYIDGKKRGEACQQQKDEIRIIFGFSHESHDCHLLSHAYITNIHMKQAIERAN